MEKPATMKDLRFLLIRIFPVFSVILLLSFTFQSDDDPRLRRILDQFYSYNQKFLQQKVYLHLDRQQYDAPGDIWFKGYVVSGPEQRPDMTSQNLYVELVNQHNSIVQTRLVRLSAGTGNGDFFLSDTVAEGNYMVRGYTGWMVKSNKDFVFSTSVYIHNPTNANFISKNDLRFNKKYNRNLEKSARKYDIQFLPEGGELTYGIRSKVAFRVENQLGTGVTATGIIYNSKKQEVSRFSTYTHGLGSFYLLPEIGEKYKAVITIENEKPFWKDLPAILENALVLNIEKSENGKLMVHLGSNFPPTNDPQANDVILIGQTHGKICFSKLVDMPAGSFDITVDESAFPTGVAQFTLFNGRGIPMAERLVFINHHDWLHIEMEEKDPVAAKREEVLMNIRVKDFKGQPVAGNFSASVSAVDSTSGSDKYSGIVADFFLKADLKGNVEDPGRLIFGDTKAINEELDLVMLTNGWRRFDWNNILSAPWPDLGTPDDKKITISGQITREFFGIPVPRANIYLSILNSYNDYYKTVADKKGRFSFENLDYPDTINVVMESNKPNGRKNVLLVLDESQSPGRVGDKGGYSRLGLVEKGEGWKYRNVNDQVYKQEEEEKKKKLEKIQPYKLHSEADNVIYMSDIPDSYTDLFQVLQGRVPGVNVTGDNVIIRGISTLYGNTEPLFLIDGVIVDKATFGALNPRDVEVIEIIKGPGTAIYGSHGANGVIAAYTKRGEFGKKGYLEFSMLGYCTPRIYYSPRYEKDKGNLLNPDKRKTLLWAPNLETDSSGTSGFRFFTSDIPGNYEITIEGMDKSGQPGIYHSLLKVTP